MTIEKKKKKTKKTKITMIKEPHDEPWSYKTSATSNAYRTFLSIHLSLVLH